MTESCKIHGEKFWHCLGGHSAHPLNWYCRLCDCESETLLNWFQKLSDRSYEVEKDLESFPFDRAETREEIVRRMK